MSIFYIVGVIGMSQDMFRGLFLLLTPANLLLTLGLIIWGEEKQRSTLVVQFIAISLFGFLYELVGVQTGLVFGEYSYGKTLGWKLFDVPLTIGVNWFILSYGSRGVAALFFKNKWLIAGFAAVLMTSIDYLIEPVAITLDMWSWDVVSVPLQNYLGWFMGAIVIQFWLASQKPYQKALPKYVIGTQIAFFLILNFIL